MRGALRTTFDLAGEVLVNLECTSSRAISPLKLRVRRHRALFNVLYLTGGVLLLCELTGIVLGVFVGCCVLFTVSLFIVFVFDFTIQQHDLVRLIASQEIFDDFIIILNFFMAVIK